MIQERTGTPNGRLEAQSYGFIDFRVHFRRLLGFTLCSLVFLWVLWGALLRPWTPKREARSVQQSISGQLRSSDICMCFIVFSEVTEPKLPSGDVLWLIVETFDHMWVALVTLFRICELNVA